MKDYEALLRLQEIDLELIRNARQLRAMPQHKKIQAINKAEKNVSSQLTQIVGERKDVEMEIADCEAEHARISSDMDAARVRAHAGDASYREVKNLEAQLSDLAKRLEKTEYKHGIALEHLEKAARAEKNARALMEKLGAEKAVQQDSLEKASAQINERNEALVGERREVVGLLDDDIIARYEAASRRFGGLAVESLRGNIPSTCGVSIQPSQYADLKDAGTITECPYCHRLLVIREEDR